MPVQKLIIEAAINEQAGKPANAELPKIDGRPSTP